jgi:hypothetical protein
VVNDALAAPEQVSVVQQAKTACRSQMVCFRRSLLGNRDEKDARHLLHGAPKDSGFATDYLHDTLLGLAMISIRVFMA